MIFARAELALNLLLPDGSVRSTPVAATVVNPLTPRHCRALHRWQETLRTHGEEDAAWNWEQMLAETGGRAEKAFQTFALVCRRDVQGAMILETRSRRSRMARRGVVYVEYVAVAPWNRATIQRPPRFRGCGTALIDAARACSRTVGRGGALALHSKEGARPFYERLGFVDLGSDEAEGGLHYFELEPR